MTEHPHSTSPETPADVPVPVHDVLSLTAGGSLARLMHQGEVYILRITRLGKLILTK
jgi:hemin uptake protein HemP